MPLLGDDDDGRLCLSMPEPFPEKRHAYDPFAPPIPAGAPSEVQVLAGVFVRGFFLTWRTEAAEWWQMTGGLGDGPYEPNWEIRSEGEVRAFCFGFLAGIRCTTVHRRAKIADLVIREAKSLAWPCGESSRNDLTGWVRQTLRPSDFGVGSVATETIMRRLLADFPNIRDVSQRSLEMRLSGAIGEAWGHERSIKRANGILYQGRRVRGWLGLEICL